MLSSIEHLKSKFHIVVVISNPVRYESRVRLFKEFRERLVRENVNFWVTELAFGDRPFECTKSNSINDGEFQFRTYDELWHKENLINLTIQRLPSDWEYVAWIDADVMFTNPKWVEETIHQLQHNMFVQMFGDAIDLGPKGEPLQQHRGFVKGYYEEGFRSPNKFRRKADGTPLGYGGSFAHTGYAWAARREALDLVGGLIDWAILGSGDHNMAMGLIGEIEKTFPSDMSSRYALKMKRWQDRAVSALKKDIGFVDGTLVHFWHGKKKDRRYVDRWKILVDNGFDPDVDLRRDSSGIYVLTDNNIRLRDEIRAYFEAREEDSIDL